MLTRRNVVLLTVAATGVALSSACGSSDGSSGAGPTPPATGEAISAQSTSLGTILVDGRGRTVYVFANDKTNASTCDGACAADWPPVPAPSPPPAPPPGVSGALGTTARSDGTRQLTVAGHPVYTFSGDSAAGQTKGQGITLNGGLWTVVSPAGAPDPNAGAGGVHRHSWVLIDRLSRAHGFRAWSRSRYSLRPAPPWRSTSTPMSTSARWARCRTWTSRRGRSPASGWPRRLRPQQRRRPHSELRSPSLLLDAPIDPSSEIRRRRPAQPLIRPSHPRGEKARNESC